MLVVNDARFAGRAEIIWEKGTNRSAFFRGEVDKYNWVDMGSSFLPSEITAAFLFAQLENNDLIKKRRLENWAKYWVGLSDLVASGDLRLPVIPDFATNNAHMFYVITHDGETRDKLLAHLKKQGVYSAFHYQSLHCSPFYTEKHGSRPLPQTDFYAACLTRLPLFFELGHEEQDFVIGQVRQFFGKK